MISQKARYAFKALIELGLVERGQALLIEEIARRACIPKKFLEQILLALKNHGIIASRRGRGGGYLLLKDPASVSFGVVLRAIDGPIAPLSCLSRSAYRRCADCPDEKACGVRHVFGDIFSATIILMDATTLEDAIRHTRSATGKEPSESGRAGAALIEAALTAG